MNKTKKVCQTKYGPSVPMDPKYKDRVLYPDSEPHKVSPIGAYCKSPAACFKCHLSGRGCPQAPYELHHENLPHVLPVVIQHICEEDEIFNVSETVLYKYFCPEGVQLIHKKHIKSAMDALVKKGTIFQVDVFGCTYYTIL